MQKLDDGQILYSPSDLMTFLGCHHASFLDVEAMIEGKGKADRADALDKLLQKKGFEHEAAYLQHLKDEGKSVIEIADKGKLQDCAQLTLKAMQSGADVIFQAVLFGAPWRGYADFLIKCDTPSDLGDFSYEVLDTKLARTASPKHIMQLCVYSELLADLQGLRPANMHLLMGDGEKRSFRLDDFFYYYQRIRGKFEAYIDEVLAGYSPGSCLHFDLCQWCKERNASFDIGDRLSAIANIQKSQIAKLLNANIGTISELASTASDLKIPDLNPDVFQRLRSQTILQHHKATTGEDKYEFIPFPPGKGFSRIPVPDDGDLFFDMEGDPIFEDGLEYLFGVYYFENGKGKFKPFWAHDRKQEKETFKRFMGFLADHLSKHPNAHIYHYNHYETTALKRLSCYHAVYEEQMDNLLRNHKFIDLYLVVRESIRTSEPGISLKNIETFYMDKRNDEVANAADSIIVYNKWREAGADKSSDLLQEISNYNEVDCKSTHLLRDWLLEIKPEDAPSNGSPEDGDAEKKEPQRKKWEIEYEDYQTRLGITEENPPEINERLSHLLEFHNREAKPQWWSIFDRQNKFEDGAHQDWIEDVECLGGLQQVGKPEPEKESYIYSYSFPSQDYKLKVGGSPVNIATIKSVGAIVEMDEDKGIVKIKRGAKEDPLPKSLSIGPGGPINSSVIRAAIYRYADRFLEAPDTNHAATELLERNVPRIQGKQPSEAVITSDDLQGDALEAIAALENSYLVIQGPPGAGKTYTSSHIIVDLIKRGKKIGVASNSHKAIHNLLEKVESVAAEKGVDFRGIKKAKGGDRETFFDGQFIISETTTENMTLDADLFAGTAWTFSHTHFDGQLDYLFIDEAGQVPTANVVAMATAAKNIVLVGDQTQLGQPIQGTHPGEAGLSVLEFLMGDHSTIPAERGIFLDQTRRMRPSICEFISDAFYDGRLTAHESTLTRSLNLRGIDLPNEGIVMIPAEHEGCSQKSVEEGEIIKAKYQALLGQEFIGPDGGKRPIVEDDILVVAPYNAQVNHLRSILPDNARVGTVDKFQGQEAPIVLISMVMSGAEDMPRNIEFLYSKNRLNVAVSRAQCLAIVVANPELQEIPCSTVEQMKLVNTFCRLDDYANNQTSDALPTC